MNKEDILDMSKKDNFEMDERQKVSLRKVEQVGYYIALILSFVFCIRDLLFHGKHAFEFFLLLFLPGLISIVTLLVKRRTSKVGEVCYIVLIVIISLCILSYAITALVVPFFSFIISSTYS